MAMRTSNLLRRQRRHRRIRAQVRGTLERPRLSVFRSTRHLSAQLIDDTHHQTLVAVSDREVEVPAAATSQRNVARARALGAVLAERAIAKGIHAVVFDRGGYAYHGRIQGVAEGAREGGLVF
ncbi:50S ribosomal protein L18 [Candidatus Uhrbacteria bacterium]|nr:50S ribosomal protein L18 [Candidatus Uhrbacteria bacterium]